MTTTVRSFTSVSQLDGGKTYNDLPIVFSGTLESCHAFCKMFAGYEWRKDSNVFGGHYAHVDNGDCLMLV